MNIQDAFDATIEGSSTKDVCVDIAEVGIDTLMEEGILKEIPIVKTFIALSQAGANIQDKLFLKKILTLLQGIGEIPEEVRQKEIKLIDDSEKYRTKVGEKLLYILDSCNDHESVDNVAKLFSAFLQKRITYQDYLDTAPIIAHLETKEIDQFLAAYMPKPHGVGIHKAGRFIHTGFFELKFEEVDVNVGPAKFDSEPEVEVSGGETYAIATKAGDTVFEVFAKEGDRKRLSSEKHYRIKQMLK